MSRAVRITPEEFSLVPYDAAEIAALLSAVADDLGLSDVGISLIVDEELFAPLVGTASDVVDGELQLWISGGNIEDRRRPRHFDPEAARLDFAAMLLRGEDRLRPGFADAPADAQLQRSERASWDVWAVGRAHRRGYPTNPQARRYEFRLQHGFTDAADEVFDELWSADDDAYDWDGLRACSGRTDGVARDAGAVSIDLLRESAS